VTTFAEVVLTEVAVGAAVVAADDGVAEDGTVPLEAGEDVEGGCVVGVAVVVGLAVVLGLLEVVLEDTVEVEELLEGRYVVVGLQWDSWGRSLQGQAGMGVRTVTSRFKRTIRHLPRLRC
jgi:hypothetical protein